MENDELNELVEFLKEQLTADKLKIPPDPNLIASLLKVRYGPNGKVDPKTVDQSVRALAVAVHAARGWQELKKVPLRDIQIKYFEILDANFAELFSEMKKHRLTAHQVAVQITTNEGAVQQFIDGAEQFVHDIQAFWGDYGPATQAHLADLKCLKAVFGGDIFPSYTKNIASSVGLYMDTIVLPDPLYRIAHFFSKPINAKSQFYYLVKHALNALSYKELVLCALDPPIVVIAPDLPAIEPLCFKYLATTSEADLLKHCSRAFGREFSSQEDLARFLSALSTPEKLIKSLSDPTRMLFNSEWTEPLEKQIERYAEEMRRDLRPDIPHNPAGNLADMIWTTFMGRMLQSNEVITKSDRFRGTPLVDAPTSWQYLIWKYEYDAAQSDEAKSRLRDTVIARAVQAEGTDDLAVISGVPPKALIELRRNGALTGMREIIRRGIITIESTSAENITRVSQEVINNINQAFSEHKHELSNLRTSKGRFFGVDVSSWVVTAGFSIAAAASGNFQFAIAAATLGTLGAPSFKDLIHKAKELDKKESELVRSPTGILFRHMKK